MNDFQDARFAPLQTQRKKMKSIILIICAFLAGCGIRCAHAEEKSIWKMTQAERKAAYEARQAASATPQERARWACSDRIKAAAHVPDSVEWVRRSQWPTLEVAGGKYRVVATYTARNRLGVTVRESKVCTL